MKGPQASAEQSISLALYRGEPHPCAYLPGRTAQDIFTIRSSLPPGLYENMMDAGFRRSGTIVYRPVCEGCRECVPIRVSVAHFSASRSQRRVQKRNADLRVEVAPPVLTDAKWRLFVDYLRFQHDDTMSRDRADLERFLYRSPTETLEMSYYAGDLLVAAGIVDVCPTALSSVYFYFDPREARRSLGIFSALCEIEECRRRGRSYWYIGYYVRECSRMNYKAQFQPHELLSVNGAWHEVPPRSRKSGP